jgi:cation:H+ antiporter
MWMLPSSDWPVWLNIAVFIGAAVVILIGGLTLARRADQIADRTGFGEAMTGVFLLGFATAAPGLAASVTAAVEGRAALSVSNAMGGIAAQTMFLAIADVAYRRANLEHAAASMSNLLQTAVLIGLMTLVMLAMSGPGWTLWQMHPATPLLLLAAIGGLLLVRRADTHPMWAPRRTKQTVVDQPDESNRRASLPGMLIGFIIAAVIVLAAGTCAARAAGALVDDTAADESLMGAVFLAFATSLPELVTTVAAVRRGALTLAVSNIVGGNVFDVLFVCFADVAYRDGSIYHAAGPPEFFVTALAIALNVLLLLGLLDRQERGVGNIGFESALILILYVAGMAVLTWGM